MKTKNNKSHPKNRNGKRASSKPFFTLAALSFAAIVSLGFFRFSASQLEHRLGSMEQSIEHYAAEELELKQSLSSLTSPIKIYSYCKDRLGMSVARQEVVRLPRMLAASAGSAEPQQNWRSNMLAFFGLMRN